MLDQIHEYGRREGDRLNDGKPVSKGKMAGKPVKMRDALESASEEDLDHFLEYVIKNVRWFFGHDWRIGALYAFWVQEGMPEQ